jgi:hypothetical protein
MTEGANKDIGKAAEKGFSEVRMKDEMLDPHQAMSRELAEQMAVRIASDVKTNDNDDLAKITASINRRDDNASTAQVDQALHDKGFPDITIHTDDKLNGQRTEIRSVDVNEQGLKVEKWWDQTGNHGAEQNGHSENTVSLPPDAQHIGEGVGRHIGAGVGQVGGKVGG